MKEEAQNFEQMLENNTTRKALVKYYRTHAWKILASIGSVLILIGLALSNLPVWARASVVLALLGVNYAYKRGKKDGS